MRAIFVLVLLAFSLTAYAEYAKVISPISQTLHEGDEALIGLAGPGQTIAIVTERETDGCRIGFCSQGWDTMTAEVPEGWSVEVPPTQESPMKLKIHIGPNAADGDYNLTIRMIDEGGYDGLKNMEYRLKVHVSRDVFDISITPTSVETGVGQPAVYTVTITNKGIASDPFEIKVREGEIPAWRFRKTVLVNYGTTKTVQYEVVLNEEGEKDFTIVVTSHSSPLIYKEQRVHVRAKSSVWNDWRATTHGVLIFPILENVAYAVMGLLAKLLGG